MIALGDVATIIDCEHRTAPRTRDDTYGFSIGTSAVRNGRIDLARAKPVSKETFESWTRRAVPGLGDLILSREAPMGEVGAVPSGTPVCLGQRTVLVRLRSDKVDSRFLRYALMAPSQQQWIQGNSAGSTVLHINVADVRKIPLPPLPPLDEQQRIVDLLEDHLSRLDAADAYLDACKRRLDALQRAVLADIYAGPTQTLASLAWASGYGTSVKCVEDGPGDAVVRIPNLVYGRIDLSDEKRVADAAADVSSMKLQAGDLLIVRTNGSVDLIGRSAVVQDGIDAAFASYLIRYRLRQDVVRPEWVQAMLSAPQTRRMIESLAASSAGQYNLSLSKLDPLKLPVPSLDAQDAGIARLHDARDYIGRLRATVLATDKRRAGLRRSVLAAAFSGRLTADPSDVSEAEATLAV